MLPQGRHPVGSGRVRRIAGQDSIRGSHEQGTDGSFGANPRAALYRPLLQKIESGAIDPSFIVTHRVKLADAPSAYKKFRDKEDGCIKVVLRP